MTDAIVVLCTFANEQDAARVASIVVEARLAACVNILSGVRSIYRWKGEIENAEEVLALVKTSRDKFSALRDRIRELHTYETPEIIAVPVIDGLDEYLGWVREQVT
jgi:periplasmic divalent cation tolerance protein